MRRIAVINQKGGVGKTTTTANVAAGLARMGHRVLLFDLDPQSHLSLHLGLDPSSGKPGVYELLAGSTSINKARVKVAENLWMVGATIDLAAAEVELVSVLGREVLLRDLLDQHVSGGEKDGRFAKYDYVFFDCPPSLGVLTLNGLCAAHEVIIPLQPHYLALQGLGKLLETVLLVSKRINAALKVAGIVICMHDAGTKLGAEVIEDVRSFLDSARRGTVPWSGARLYDTVIRRNIKLAESPSYGQSIFAYAPDSNGAKDYERLARELHDPSSLERNSAEPQVEAVVEEKKPVVESEPVMSVESAPAAKAVLQAKPSPAKKATTSDASQKAKPVRAVKTTKPPAEVKAPAESKPKPVPACRPAAKVAKPAAPAAKSETAGALTTAQPMAVDPLSAEMSKRRKELARPAKPLPANRDGRAQPAKVDVIPPPQPMAAIPQVNPA